MQNKAMRKPSSNLRTSRITLYVDQRTHDALMAIADKNAASLSWVVRRAILDLTEKDADNQPKRRGKWNSSTLTG